VIELETSVAARRNSGAEASARQRATPAVSVLIVNHNGGADLAACLDSLRNADYDAYEVIVVDNASTDGSTDHLGESYPDVRLIGSAENLGFGGGNNLAATHARGEYLAFLNPDTVVDPGWLRALIETLERDTWTGLATSMVLLKESPERVNACGNAMHTTGLTLCRGMAADRAAYPFEEEVDAVSGAAFAMRRSLYEALGGFDEAFFLYMEDTDLSLRARLAGYTCRYVPGSIVYHDYQLRFGPRKTYYQERNRCRMLLKTLRWGTLASLAPTLLLGEIVTWGFALLRDRGHLTNKLEAYVWVARHWREIMAARRATQATRRVRDRDLLSRTTHHLALDQVERGPLQRLAQFLLDPLFLGFRWLSLAVIRW